MNVHTLTSDVESLNGITNATPMMAGMHNQETDVVMDWDPDTILDSDIVEFIDSHEETKGKTVELTQSDNSALVVTIH